MITRKSDQPIHQKPAHEENETAYIKSNNKYIPVTILAIPINEEDEPYTVQEKDNGTIHELPSSNILKNDPTQKPTDTNELPNHMYSWVQHDCKATMFLSEHWATPKQGHQSSQKIWNQ